MQTAAVMGSRYNAEHSRTQVYHEYSRYNRQNSYNDRRHHDSNHRHRHSVKEQYSRESSRSDVNSQQQSESNNNDTSDHRPSPLVEYGDWAEYKSSSGKIYYYNSKTEVSQWEMPDEWKTAERASRHSHDRERDSHSRCHRRGTGAGGSASGADDSSSASGLVTTTAADRADTPTRNGHLGKRHRTHNDSPSTSHVAKRALTTDGVSKPAELGQMLQAFAKQMLSTIHSQGKTHANYKSNNSEQPSTSTASAVPTVHRSTPSYPKPQQQQPFVPQQNANEMVPSCASTPQSAHNDRDMSMSTTPNSDCSTQLQPPTAAAAESSSKPTSTGAMATAAETAAEPAQQQQQQPSTSAAANRLKQPDPLVEQPIPTFNDPAFAQFLDDRLTRHVNGWSGDALDAHANDLSTQATTLSLTLGTKLADLKCARSLVRTAHIRCTLLDERVKYVREQYVQLGASQQSSAAAPVVPPPAAFGSSRLPRVPTTSSTANR